MDKLQEQIAIEKEICRCSEKLIVDDEGNLVCSHLCGTCRNFDASAIKCDIYENVRCALCEDEEYERLMIDDYS